MRLVFDAKDQYPSQWAAIESIAGKIGCTSETLRKWVRQGERDSGVRAGPTTVDQQRIKELEREVRELRTGLQHPEVGQRLFRAGGARPPSQEMNAFIGEHRARCGVEPICSALQVATSAYRRHAARQRNPALLPARAGVTRICCRRSSACTTRTCGSTALTRSGGSSDAKARRLRAAPSSG